MPSTYRLIFRGEILPGHQLETVQQRASMLFKTSPEQCARLFSGQPAVIRKGIAEADLSKYLATLQKAGLKIHAEREDDLPTLFQPDAPEPEARPAPPPSVKPPPAPVSPSNPSPATAPQFGEQVTCPKCGHVQLKRTLCLKCSADMPAYQRALEQEKAAPFQAQEESLRYDQAPRATCSQPPAIFGFGFSGRWGRLSWLNAALFKSALGFLLLAIAMIVITNSISQGGSTTTLILFGLIFLLTVPLSLYWSFRDAALRCHDLGYSGFWSLLYLIPVISLLFSLGLLFLPGQKEDNEYDSPPLQDSWLLTIVALLLMGALAVVSVNKMTKFVQTIQTMESQLKGRNSSMAPTGANQVVMYSLTTCGYCDQKRTELKANGIAFTEYFLDRDPQAQATLWQQLKQSGYDRRSVGTPTLVVNGTVLPNNPGMAQIRSQLH